jgi:hypothetical protein
MKDNNRIPFMMIIGLVIIGTGIYITTLGSNKLGLLGILFMLIGGSLTWLAYKDMTDNS